MDNRKIARSPEDFLFAHSKQTGSVQVVSHIPTLTCNIVYRYILEGSVFTFRPLAECVHNVIKAITTVKSLV